MANNFCTKVSKNWQYVRNGFYIPFELFFWWINNEYGDTKNEINADTKYQPETIVFCKKK